MLRSRWLWCTRKKIHLLIVSKDLSYFAHEHPVEKEEGYYVLSHTFPTGGEYVLFADYTPIGGHEKVKRHHIMVTPYHPHDVKSRAGADVKTQDLIWEANGYRVYLETQNGSGSFTANTPVVLKAKFHNGQRVSKFLWARGRLWPMPSGVCKIAEKSSFIPAIPCMRA